jgi:chromate transport protein ChrA
MKTWQTLGYAGLLPFVACLYLSLETSTVALPARQAFIAYSAIILSFIAGTLWRRSSRSGEQKQNIISNIFSLLAFVCLLVAYDIALIILALGFALIFIYELASGDKTQDTNDYRVMRFRLTAIVVALHFSAFYLWFA